MTADGAFGAMVIQTRPGEFATLPVLSLAHVGAEAEPINFGFSYRNRLQLAQFADGGTEGSSFHSVILLFNPDPVRSCAGNIFIRDDAGNPMTIDLNGEIVERTAPIQIPAGAIRRLRTDGMGDLRVGSVVVDTDEPLGGVILFGGDLCVAGVGCSRVQGAAGSSGDLWPWFPRGTS